MWPFRQKPTEVEVTSVARRSESHSWRSRSITAGSRRRRQRTRTYYGSLLNVMSRACPSRSLGRRDLTRLIAPRGSCAARSIQAEPRRQLGQLCIDRPADRQG